MVNSMNIAAYNDHIGVLKMKKEEIDQVIDEKQALFITASDKIWEFAETRFQEAQSADLLCRILSEEGFTVQREIGGLATAFMGSFGSGKPVIGILGEYDALSGLSQKALSFVKEAEHEGGNGHGCGHNLLGAGALAAAVAVKEYLLKNNLTGTIRFYGCPGEEGGSGKSFMVREGVFNDVDIALTWHPMTHNAVMSVTTLANFQVYFRFHGLSAHAAAAPHLGRSALDAVELMNIGVNYLREHIIQEARIHYAVTNSGGISPNVVQAEAEVLYLIRAPRLEEVAEIYERVCNIAKGAALMTDTRCEIVFDKACSNYIPNHTIEELLFKNFDETGSPVFNEQEREFAQKIQVTLAENDINNDLKMADLYMGGQDKSILDGLREQELAGVLLPYAYSSALLSGSTDVGDVSFVVPTAQLCTACNAFGTPGHSWQTVAQGVSSIAHKGMLTAAKVLAKTAVDIFLQPEVAEEAKKELRKTLDGKAYVSPIPAGVMPSIKK